MTSIELPDIDYPEPSRLFDIDQNPPVPLWLQLLQQLSLQAQSSALQVKIEREMDALGDRIRADLGDLKAGYLIRLNMYADEHGQVVVPGGQIVLPVGIGTEQIDALAELLRLPGIQAERPNLRNFSSYLWLFKKDGQLKGRSIPADFRDNFEADARAEALARSQLAEWVRIVPDSMWGRIQRAEYWSRMLQQREHLIEAEAWREQIKALTAEMSNLEKQVNAASESLSGEIMRDCIVF